MSVKLLAALPGHGGRLTGRDPLKEAEQTLQSVRENIERLDEMALHAKALVKSKSAHASSRPQMAVSRGVLAPSGKAWVNGPPVVCFESLTETVDQVQVQAQLLGASMSLHELHGAHRDASSTLRWVGFYTEMLQELNQRLENTLATMAAKGLLDD